MLLIGSHVSFKNDTQLLGSVKEAISYGSTTFMFYTGAPQNTTRSTIKNDLTIEALKVMKDNGIPLDKVIVHAPYIINLANPDKEKYEFSIRFLKEEMKRCDAFGVSYMVLHPGSHVGVGIEEGIKHIVSGLNQLLEDDTKVMILLETMAGKGSEVGRNLEEIKEIIDGVENKKRIGVCLDTCHLHDSGYDLTDFDSFLKKFDAKVGLSYVHCVHVNDSKNECGSHKDRHENIGFGYLGFKTLLKIIYHPLLEEVPKILETPYINKEHPPYKEEIAMIKAKKFNKSIWDTWKN